MPQNKRLMIIDDSKVSRMMIKAIIKDKHPDIEILEAGDGAEALSLAKENNIDFFSVDYNMPKMDGIEFITEMRKLKSSAKFSLLTANIQDATHQKAKELKAACINKPINEACISKMMEYFND